MNNQEQEYFRLTNPETLTDTIESLDIFIEVYHLIIFRHHYDELSKSAEGESKIILQMMLLKLIELKQLLEGVGYKKSDGGVLLQNIVDPTIIATVTRNIYEMTCAFHLIFVSPTNDQEQEIIYNLWKIAGLNYRQRFATNVSSSDNATKLVEENGEIQNLTAAIQSNPIYIGLDSSNKSKIESRISRKEYRIKFGGGNVQILEWHAIPVEMGCRQDFFDNMYTYFSLYAHPSYVSVFQFEYLFSKANRDHEKMAIFNMRFALSIASLFISDYLKIFPSNLVTFESFPILNQALVNFHNKVLRGDEYSINMAYLNI